MRFSHPYAAIGLALVVGAPVVGAPAAAHAQTIITGPAPAVVAQPPLLAAPAATIVQPVETIQTVQTVRTVRAAPLPPVRHQVVTTRTITRQVTPVGPLAPTVVARTAAPQPLYDVAPAAIATPAADIYAAPAPAYNYSYAAPAYNYSYAAPLYDVAPAAVATAPLVGAPVVATQPVIYRYVYEPDRILVIDPTTNIAIQAIPR
jgi:hypothetical protein